jgi:hypothetical protein
MILAIGQRHIDVDDLEAKRPLLHCFARTRLDGRYIVSRYSAALDAFAEGEAMAAFVWPDAELHIGELAGAACLLAVPVTHVRGLGDGLPVDRIRCAVRNFDPEDLRQRLA